MGRASSVVNRRCDACFIVRDANRQALAYVYYGAGAEAARGGVGAATAASLPRVLIMASSLRPRAVHHSSSIEAWAHLIDTPVADKLLRHPVGAPFGSGRR